MPRIAPLVALLGLTLLANVALAQTPGQVAGPMPPVRVGGLIKAPQKIKHVAPVYPAIAVSARKEGTVILELLIAPSGTVESARVIRSVPLLDHAALDAVAQWEYEPTLVSGVAVSVFYNVTVTFSLRSPAADPAASQPVEPGTNTAAQSTTAGNVDQAADQAAPPVRVGGVIRPPVKVVDVSPIYPADAQEARVQGTVILELLIAPEGHVQEVKILRSVPMLDQAALDAVSQWIYTPTLLGDVPVPVLYNVTVTFSLDPQ